MHESLFLESKYATNSPLWNLYDQTKAMAKAEKKTPVIGLQRKRSKGILLVIHSDDLALIIQEWDKVQMAPVVAEREAKKPKTKKAKRAVAAVVKAAQDHVEELTKLPPKKSAPRPLNR